MPHISAIPVLVQYIILGVFLIICIGVVIRSTNKEKSRYEALETENSKLKTTIYELISKLPPGGKE